MRERRELSGIGYPGIDLDQTTFAELQRGLEGQLELALGGRLGKFSISFLSRADDVPDGTTVFLLRDASDRPRAVVLCAAPASPDNVRRAVYRAQQAKALLGPVLGTPILDPMMEGTVQGLSYAVMPYCKVLSDVRPIWWMQRLLLRPVLLEWLRRATECTVRDVEPMDLHRSFDGPLREVASFTRLDRQVRAAAARAAERLHGGAWKPRFVLMHSDFWKGNVLIRPRDDAGDGRRWHDRFTIIDWGGSETRGYAIFDLIRMSRSLRLNTRSLRDEIAVHCQLLKCNMSDAMSYLLAALGYIAMNLEHFPVDAYARMAHACFATLDETMD